MIFVVVVAACLIQTHRRHCRTRAHAQIDYCSMCCVKAIEHVGRLVKNQRGLGKYPEAASQQPSHSLHHIPITIYVRYHLLVSHLLAVRSLLKSLLNILLKTMSLVSGGFFFKCMKKTGKK